MTPRALLTCALALLTLGTGLPLAASFARQDEEPSPGALVVVGGGGTPQEVLIEGLARTGVASPHVVILPQASGREDRGQGSVEMFRELGIQSRVTPRISLQDGIEAARVMLKRCRFDRVKCGQGVVALRQYRKQFDASRNAFGDRP